MKDKAILCVDDEKIVLDTLKSQIKRHFGDKYLCEIALSVDEALEIIEELTADDVRIIVIVSDWLMPGIRGDEFLINVHKRFPGIVKVLLTGQADQQSVDKIKRHAELYECIYKPWKEEELIHVIKRALKEIQ